MTRVDRLAAYFIQKDQEKILETCTGVLPVSSLSLNAQRAFSVPVNA